MTIIQYKPAAPSASLMTAGLAAGKYQYQDDGLYKRCAGCGDYWPADTEFFFARKVGDGIDNKCRACYLERRYPNGRKGQPCQQ
jgi:hypothetical protein